MEKARFFLVFILFLFILIYIISRTEVEGSHKQILPSWIKHNNTGHLADMENRMARDNNENDNKSSIDEIPDYTKLYPELYTEFINYEPNEKGKKIAYLTFDDGPSKNTFRILDILEEADIKATFFIVGSVIDEEGEVCLKRMMNEGHTIGIHTYSHVCSEIYCSVERYLEDFNKVYRQIHEITGERVNIYRFPWGSNNGYSLGIKDALISEMERRGFTCYDWNVDANDSVGRPTEYSIKKNIRKDIKGQDHPVILLHDSSVNDLTVRTLPGILGMITDMGYEFDTLDKREPYKFEW